MTYFYQTGPMVGLWLNVYVSGERESQLEGRAFVFVDSIQCIEPMPHAGQSRVRLEGGYVIHALHPPSDIVDRLGKATP